MQQYIHNPNLNFYHPDTWSGEYDFEYNLITFLDPEDGFGALQFTVFYPPEKEEVSLKDWLIELLIDTHPGCKVTENGRYARSENLYEGSTCWRYWAIKKGNMVLLGTYNCDEQYQGKEDPIVDEIVESIFK